MQRLFILLSLIALIALGAFAYSTAKNDPSIVTESSSFEDCVTAGYPVMESYPARCKTPDGEIFTQDIGNEMEMTEKIRIDGPRPNATITSPLTITGEAVGGWYFEATFPVALLDEDGNLITEYYATAKDDWMTSEFVPFSATLQFSTPKGATGTLILKKDNPSGLPEKDAALRIPVRFNQETPTTAIQVFWGHSNEMGTECTSLTSFTRTLPKTEGVLHAALTELLRGPTPQEQEGGYFSSLPQNAAIKIKSLRIENGTAYVDFSKELGEGVAGSCRVTHIRAQIENTIKQFSTVKNVIISIDGKTDDILQP